MKKGLTQQLITREKQIKQEQEDNHVYMKRVLEHAALDKKR